MKSHLADYGSRPVEIVGGDGCYCYDREGKRYVDFLAGWCVGNIGWKRNEVRMAIQREAERGIYVPPVLRFPEWEEFASRLCEIAPSKMLTRAFRCTSGSEAVEFALKCARAATGKHKIVSVDGVYHGHTYGAASVGDACGGGMAPCIPGFLKVRMPDAYRGAGTKEVLGEIEALFQGGDVAAFLSEPVWSNAGSFIPPSDFYPNVQELCKKYGVLLVVDEVATGFGRCGTLFASELWGLKPGILCLGKALTGGYGTLGATLVTEEIFEASREIPSYSTFGWLPTDLAAARANVEVILREKLWENAREVGDYLFQKLKPFEELPYVGEVRGVGLLLGVEIVRDKANKEKDFRRAVVIQNACAKKGLLIETAGNTLFITPPLILTKEIADEGVEILTKCLMSNV